jgi:septal ring factor EnvC (AmiA/AmiB activator)
MLNVSFCDAFTPHDEYKKIQKEIKAQKQKLEDVKRHESSVLAEMEHTSKQLKATESELNKYKNKLMNTELRIAQVETEISQNKIKIERHREWLKRKLRTIHRYGHNSDVVMLFLGADDISQLIRSGKYLQYITVYEHKVLNSYKGTLEDLTEKENQLMALKKELITNREKVKDEEKSLEEKKKNKEMLLASVKKEKSSRTRMLKEMEDASKKLLEIIRESEKTEKGEFFRKRLSGLKENYRGLLKAGSNPVRFTEGPAIQYPYIQKRHIYTVK